MNDKRRPTDIAFSDAVRAAQEKYGSRRQYARLEEKGYMHGTLDDDVAAFIARRDSFYFGTASASGRPYIQHRGGLPGFLKVIDDHTLAFADYAGNRQYISAGNLSENPQAFLFLMDYANRRRVKIWGRAEAVDDDVDFIARVSDSAYSARAERAIRIHVDAWDANCPNHILPRYSEDQVARVVARLESRIEDLEVENARLTAALRQNSPGQSR